jgi:hypothetical protein
MMDQTRQGLDQSIEDQLESKAKRHTRPYVVMTQQEVQCEIAKLESMHLLMVRLAPEKSLPCYMLTCNYLFFQARFCVRIDQKSFKKRKITRHHF